MTATRTAPKPQPRTSYPTDPAAVAAGYRHLADLIESGACPIPIGPKIDVFLTRTEVDEQPAAARDLMRALGGGKYEKDTEASPGYLILQGMVGGLPVDVWVNRSAVCERVVVGTREVTEKVRVGEDTRPTETVTRTEDVVSWRCGSILAAAETDDAIEVEA